MKTNFVDSLDTALERVRQGEEVTAVLQSYPTQAEDLAPLLYSANLLSECEPVTMPAPEELLADQQHFINQLAQLPLPAVSPTPFMRLSEWMVLMLSWLKLNPNRAKKEQKNMGTLLLKATLILTLLFGTAGGTAVMAAESLPDSPLYPAKIMAENVRLSFASNQTEQAEIHLDLAAERLREMERLIVDGNIPNDATLARAENHIEAAFGLAEEMPVQEMAGVLMQAQEMLQARTRAFEDIEAEIPSEVEPAFNRVQQMLQNAGEVTAAGLQDPQLLRQRHSVNRPDTAPVRPEIQPPAVIISPTQTITTPVRNEPLGPCASGSEGCDPQGEGPYGPAYNGPKPEEPGTPAEKPGPGEPNDNEPGNPDPVGPPEEPGNPDSGCPDCGQQGTQNGYGPEPDDSGNGSGMPGGSEEGIPIGGQSQNGTQYQAPGNNAAPPDQGGNNDGAVSKSN
jgi:hypothetical protein